MNTQLRVESRLLRDKAPANNPWRVKERPGGGFAVDKFEGGSITRWGTYPTREKADEVARFANRAHADATEGRIA